MKVPFIDLKKRYLNESKDLNLIINKILKSGNLIGSNDVNKFEKDISKFLNKKFCISLNSGTDALMLALHALNIKKEMRSLPHLFLL